MKPLNGILILLQFAKNYWSRRTKPFFFFLHFFLTFRLDVEHCVFCHYTFPSVISKAKKPIILSAAKSHLLGKSAGKRHHCVYHSQAFWCRYICVYKCVHVCKYIYMYIGDHDQPLPQRLLCLKSKQFLLHFPISNRSDSRYHVPLPSNSTN